MQASLGTIPETLESSETFIRYWSEFSSETTQSVTDFVTGCYERLCTLPRSGWVPGDVIFGIWGITNKKLGWIVVDSLVDFHLLLEFKNDQGIPRFSVHDVLLDYCKKMSQTGKHPKYELYHREFLSHVWKLCDREVSSAFDTVNAWNDCNGVLGAYWDQKACEKCRPWWKILSSSEEVPEIGEYLLENLFWHLKEGDRLAEAVGLLSHIGWTKLRSKQGGICALNADFMLVKHATSSGRTHNDTRLGIESIWYMVKKAWSLILKYSKALPTHGYGYLVDNGNQAPLVERYLQSVSDIVTGPWLRPRNAFWRMLDSTSNQRGFRTAEDVVDVVVMSSSNSIIAATTSMLFWIDMKTMSARREKVIRNERTSQERISAFCFCEARRFWFLDLILEKSNCETA